GSFVGVDTLEVNHMVDDSKFTSYAISPKHVARHPCDFKCLAAVVPLTEGDHRGSDLPLIFQTSEPPGQQLHLCDFRNHVGQFRLDDLHGGERVSELLSFRNIPPCPLIAILGRAERAEHNAEARAIQTLER